MDARPFEFECSWSHQRIDHEPATDTVGAADHDFPAIFSNASVFKPHFYTSPVYTRTRVGMPYDIIRKHCRIRQHNAGILAISEIPADPDRLVVGCCGYRHCHESTDKTGNGRSYLK